MRTRLYNTRVIQVRKQVVPMGWFVSLVNVFEQSYNSSPITDRTIPRDNTRYENNFETYIHPPLTFGALNCLAQ